MNSRLAPAWAREASLAAMPPASSAISPDQMCTRSSLKPMGIVLSRYGEVALKHRTCSIIPAERGGGNELGRRRWLLRLAAPFVENLLLPRAPGAWKNRVLSS